MQMRTAPSSACGGGLGRGLLQRGSAVELAPSLALPRKRGRELNAAVCPWGVSIDVLCPLQGPRIFRAAIERHAVARAGRTRAHRYEVQAGRAKADDCLSPAVRRVRVVATRQTADRAA